MKEEEKGGQAGESEAKDSSRPIGGLRTQSKYGTFGGSAQTPGSLDVQTPGRLDAQTPGKKKRRRRTVYIEQDIDSWIRERISKSEEEMSALINEALRAFMSR